MSEKQQTAGNGAPERSSESGQLQWYLAWVGKHRLFARENHTTYQKEEMLISALYVLES